MEFSTTESVQKRGLKSWLSTLDHQAPSSSNTPSTAIAFQRWFKFKEAFAPNLVLDCIGQMDFRPKTCLDPFGGCGTTGLTCQFAGISPTLIEVNPFIADLAESKLATYDIDKLQDDYLTLRRAAERFGGVAPTYLAESSYPTTLREPGERNRWVFSREVFDRITTYSQLIAEIEDDCNRRLFRVLLGSVLVEASNVVVNGKGRKYRNNWKHRQKLPDDVDALLDQAFLNALADLQRHPNRPERRYKVLRGSCLDRIQAAEVADFSIFSPPYPNSFDYTDIYNLELWMLGYLRSRDDNLQLRRATLRSHVQVAMESQRRVVTTKTLDIVHSELDEKRSQLWDARIPSMIQGYFSDMSELLALMQSKITPGGDIFMVVGDSCYAGTAIPVGTILGEVAVTHGYEVKDIRVLRQMRKSAQQGGAFTLAETLVSLKRPK